MGHILNQNENCAFVVCYAIRMYVNVTLTSQGASCCDRGEYWRWGRTEWSKGGPIVVKKKTERVNPA